MANVTTNPPWKDYPDTSTLITASALNNIEEALNEASAGADVLGGLTDLESERGMRAMRVALESGTARIVAMGDSKTEGAGVSAIGDRWLNVLQNNLRARYSTADTGLGYLPSYYATFYGFSTAPVIAGTHTKIDNGAGLGNRTTELALGATITWTVPAWAGGITMPLHYARFAGGGSIEVVTGGTVRATIATAGSDASLVSNVSIPAGTTSIVIRPKAGTAPVRVSGIVHRTSTSGIIVYDAAHSGAIAADYTGGRGTNPASDELHWQAVSAVDPHGIIMAFGANDQSDPPGGRTVEQWQDDVGDLFTRAKAAAPAAGLVLLVGAQRTEEAGDPSRIRAFEKAAREAVSDRPNTSILYESRLWSPIIGEDYTDGDGIWLSDTVHLNAAGSRAVALYLAGEITSNNDWAVTPGQVTGTYHDLSGAQTPFGPGKAKSIGEAVNSVSGSLGFLNLQLSAKAPMSHTHAYADITDPPTIPGPQTLSLTGSDLSLSGGGGTVTLPESGGTGELGISVGQGGLPGRTSRGVGDAAGPTDGHQTAAIFNITAPTRITALTCGSHTLTGTGGVIRAAVYVATDYRNGIGALVADLGTVPINGGNSVSVLDSPPLLAPGWYWLVSQKIHGSDMTYAQIRARQHTPFVAANLHQNHWGNRSIPGLDVADPWPTSPPALAVGSDAHGGGYDTSLVSLRWEVEA